MLIILIKAYIKRFQVSLEEKNGFWLGFFALLMLTAWYFQGLYTSPNGFMGVNGDGYKNYATIEYHVKNDASYHRFEGMNYPYDEHLAFADAQPILANAIKFFSTHFIDISDHTRAIIHTFLLLSVLFCFLFIYLIFRQLNQKKHFASLAACGITFLSPQLARWEEHYALGYLFVLPALIYFLLLFHKKNDFHYSFLIGFLTIFAAQIHLYYLGIIVLFVSSFHFWRTGFNPLHWRTGFNPFIIERVKTRSPVHFAIQILLPVAFIAFYWLKIGDKITDRPSVPGGFLTYKALWQGLFNHQNSFVFNIIQWKTPYIFSLMENVVYLGIAVFLGGIFLMIKKIKSIQKNKLDSKNIFLGSLEESPLPLLLLTSLPLFLLALGLPFIISDWEKYLEWTGPLQQFRGVGRFAWVFFYLINIFIFVAIGNYEGRFKTWIQSFFLLILLLDAAYLHRKPMSVLPHNFFSKNIQVFGNQKNIDWKKYQAILPLPYFQIGSEQFDIAAEKETLPYIFYFCIEKKLPCMGAQMSRTSFEQMYRLQRFATAQNEEKPLLLNDLKAGKPILIIQNKKAFEKDTLFKSWNHFDVHYLAENEFLRFYESNLEWKGETKTDTLPIVATKRLLLHEENIVFNGNLEGQKANQSNILSFDWLCSEQSQPLLEYQIRELDAKTGAQLHFLHYGCRYFRTGMKNNHFVSCEIPFESWHADSKVEVKLFYRKANKNVPLVLKNFAIRN